MATFEETINELVGDTEEASADSPSGCFSPNSINPINRIILAVFGENYFPPYNVGFQPEKKGKLVDEKLLQMQLPGGGKIKPIGTPIHTSIADYITPVTGLLGSVFNFFGPIFIILDVLRGIIDIICAMFNPVPVIAAVVDLFVTILPPLIALFPPLSTILLALNTVKLILSIVVSMISSIAPIIEQIVFAALSIPTLLLEGSIAAINGVTAQICALITHLENQIGSLAPIKFIIELLNTFLELGAKLFCIKGILFGEDDSPCCTRETCPPVIVNPPAGRALVIRDINRFSLLDLINFGLELVFPIVKLVSDFIELIINTFISTINDVFNAFAGVVKDSIQDITDGVNTVVDGIEAAVNSTLGPAIDIIIGLFQLVNVLGVLDELIEELDGNKSVDLPVFNPGAFAENLLSFELPTVDIPAPRTLGEAIDALPLFADALALFGLSSESIEQIFDSIVFVQPEMEIQMLITGGNHVVSQPNRNGLISEFGVGHHYTIPELLELQNFIVEPEKIPVAQVVDDPATLRIDMRKLDLVTGELGPVVEEVIVIPRKNIFGQYIVTGNVSTELFGVDVFPPDRLTIRSDAFALGDIIQFEIKPDQIALLSLNLIGIGCHDDVAAAALGLGRYINADSDSAAATGGSGDDTPGSGANEGFSGFDSLGGKIGIDFPQPPIAALEECLALQASNPAISQVDCFADTLGTYIEELTSFHDSVLCVGVSRIQSTFVTSQNFVLADGEDFTNITLSIKDVGGNNLLLGAIPTSSFRVQFHSTIGTFGPTIFDSTLGSFTATLTHTEEGVAEITAEFIVKDKVCMRPGLFDGFVVTDNILNVEFVPTAGKFPRRRKIRQYVQSAGGRRR